MQMVFQPDWKVAPYPVSDEAWEYHRTLKGYSPTPLHTLDQTGAETILVKDESQRLGLGSFKGLGASYAIHKSLQIDRTKRTFCAASDGNHGIGVAWAAQLHGCASRIILPPYVTEGKRAVIKRFGGVILGSTNSYDDAVEAAITESQKQGWSLIQDFGWKGYADIPYYILEGYETIIREINREFDVIFLQVGVGSFAFAICNYLVRMGKRPRIILVEPERSNGMLQSLKHGALAPPSDPGPTIMDGLNCGQPFGQAFDFLSSVITGAITVSDEEALEAVEVLRKNGISAGPSGAAGFAGFLKLKDVDQMMISQEDTILCVNTEGGAEATVSTRQ